MFVDVKEDATGGASPRRMRWKRNKVTYVQS